MPKSTLSRFLHGLLVRKAAAIRKRESLASWLHGVAYRISVKLAARSARRRAVEQEAVRNPEQTAMDSATWNEVRTVLDEEISAPAKQIPLAPHSLLLA